MTLREFSFEVNLRTIVREDKTVVFEAWAWVPKNDKVAAEWQYDNVAPPQSIDNWIRISAQERTLEYAVNAFYEKVHEFCNQYWEPEPEIAQRPKRKIRIDRA